MNSKIFGPATAERRRRQARLSFIMLSWSRSRLEKTFDSRRRLRATDNFGLSPPGPWLLLLCYLCPTLIGFPHHFYHRQHVPRYQFYWEFDPKTSPTQLQSFDVQQCDRTPATETFWFKEICILMLFKITRVQAEHALPILRTSHICPRTRRSCSSTLN